MLDWDAPVLSGGTLGALVQELALSYAIGLVLNLVAWAIFGVEPKVRVRESGRLRHAQAGALRRHARESLKGDDEARLRGPGGRACSPLQGRSRASVCLLSVLRAL